ncbi:hypothetical protein [Streptomyces cavernae]|uniref:Rv1733c family protein n=1 Tax=Streptomyces cavernae TaxID=2259034 RepID=UPI000FEC0D94|nr:hypothetical protein [Streptomyces cavernae]
MSSRRSKRSRIRTTRRLWRWRSNPLRRRDDVIEAWVVLTVWAVVVVGGALAGLVTALAAQETFAQQRAERHSVRAELVADVPRSASAGARDMTQATVRWTGPDGSARTGRALVKTGQQAGAAVVIWTDGEGRLSIEPPSPVEGAVEAGFMGTTAALAAAGTAFGAGALVRWRLEKRRVDRWGTEWALVGPQWGHKTG